MIFHELTLVLNLIKIRKLNKSFEELIFGQSLDQIFWFMKPIFLHSIKNILLQEESSSPFYFLLLQMDFIPSFLDVVFDFYKKIYQNHWDIIMAFLCLIQVCVTSSPSQSKIASCKTGMSKYVVEHRKFHNFLLFHLFHKIMTFNETGDSSSSTEGVCSFYYTQII